MLKGFDVDMEASDDHNKIRFATDCIDRLLACSEDETILKLISEYSIRLLNSKNNNWTYQNAALMALSQIGEYIEDLNNVVPIVRTSL